MAGMGGFAGLAAVNQGYDRGAQDYWRTRGMENDDAAMQALGRGMQLLAPQGAIPGALPQMGGPPMGGPQPPMAGPAPVTGMRPQMGGAPPMMGGPAPAPMPGGAPMQMPMGGGPPPSPQAPPGPPPGQPPMGGGPPGPGGQFRTPMSWEDITRAVVQANPGARPEVIAQAVTKAMPLMTMDSQQQWRIIQAQLQQERIQQQGELGRGRIETTQRGQDISSADRRMVE